MDKIFGQLTSAPLNETGPVHLCRQYKYSSVNNYFLITKYVLMTYCNIPGGGGGGVLRFGSDGGVPLKPPNPYLSLRVILAEKGTHY